MTSRIFENNQVRSQTGFHQLAALFLAATSPTANEHEASSAFRAIRTRICNGKVDPHAVADRIRGRETFAPCTTDTPPGLVSMPSTVRKQWMDAVALRLRLTLWERQFLTDIREKALSTSARMSPAQLRTLQGLVDRAWQKGVRP